MTEHRPMSQQIQTNVIDESIDACELTQSERNRYFHGKLMTARDMAAEQKYHRRLFTRRSQGVNGYGVVAGLEAEVQREEEALSVTIEPGYAIDCCGRPVVVPAETTIQKEDFPDADRLGLIIEYSECVTESVPIPGSEDACERECAYNRVVETFDIDVVAADADRVDKPVPSVEFPERDRLVPDDTSEHERELEEIAAQIEEARDAGEDDRIAELRADQRAIEATLEGRIPVGEIDDTHPSLLRLASEWAAQAALPIGCDRENAHEIYLGSFEQPDDSITVEPEFRPRVYSNDMLYSAIVRHTADFRNPHQVSAEQLDALVSVKGVGNPGGNVDLTSEHIDFDTDPTSVGEHTIDLQIPGMDELLAHLDDTDNPHDVTAAQTEAMVSIEGTEHEGGNIDFVSEVIEFSGRDNAVVEFSVPYLHEIDHRLTEHVNDTDNPHEVDVGGGDVDTINGTESDEDGDIELVSPNGTIDVILDRRRIEDHQIGLDVSQEFGDQFENLFQQIRTIRERLDAKDRYLVVRSVRVVAKEYESAQRRFRLFQTREIVNACWSFLSEVEHGEDVDAAEYRHLIDGLVGPQRAVLEELEARVAGTGVIDSALDDVEEVIDEDPVTIAKAQIHAAEMVGALLDPPPIE